MGRASVEALGIVEGEGTFGRAGRAGEGSGRGSNWREVAFENVKGGMLPGPEDNGREWITSVMRVNNECDASGQVGHQNEWAASRQRVRSQRSTSTSDETVWLD